jgi:hypothetical protein
MTTMRHTYKIETFHLNQWAKIADYVTREFCNGVLWKVKHDAPRLAYRVVRSDGKIMDELPAVDEVSVGMVAGFPTPEQYERAAAKALEKAAAIRERMAKDAR